MFFHFAGAGAVSMQDAYSLNGFAIGLRGPMLAHNCAGGVPYRCLARR